MGKTKAVGKKASNPADAQPEDDDVASDDTASEYLQPCVAFILAFLITVAVGLWLTSPPETTDTLLSPQENPIPPQKSLARLAPVVNAVKSLQSKGLNLRAALEVRPILDAGLGITIGEAATSIEPDAVLAFVAKSLLVTTSDVAKSHAQKVLPKVPPQFGAESNVLSIIGLPLTVLLQRRNPSQHPSHAEFIESLPPECPDNLAAMSKNELTLLSSTATLRSAVSIFELQKQTIRAGIPDATDSDVKWAICIVQSRAVQLPLFGYILIPFLDLLNHGASPSCKLQQFQDGVGIMSLRQLMPGDEVTLGYSASTRLRWLTDYGFVPPEEKTVFQFQLDTRLPSLQMQALRSVGCDLPLTQLSRISLPAKPTVKDIHGALRCFRAATYGASLTSFKVEHLDRAWDEGLVTGVTRPKWLLEDYELTAAVLEACQGLHKDVSRQFSADERERLATRVRTTVLEEVNAELAAILGCARGLKVVPDRLKAAHHAVQR